MIHDIRFIERDGKNILQRLIEVYGVGTIWEDVPFEFNP